MNELEAFLTDLRRNQTRIRSIFTIKRQYVKYDDLAGKG